MNNYNDLLRVLASAPGYTIVADRALGKTTALQQTVFNLHKGNAAVITSDQNTASFFLNHYKEKFGVYGGIPQVLTIKEAEDGRLLGKTIPVYSDEVRLSAKLRSSIDYRGGFIS